MGTKNSQIGNPEHTKRPKAGERLYRPEKWEKNTVSRQEIMEGRRGGWKIFFAV